VRDGCRWPTLTDPQARDAPRQPGSPELPANDRFLTMRWRLAARIQPLQAPPVAAADPESHRGSPQSAGAQPASRLTPVLVSLAQRDQVPVLQAQDSLATDRCR
jgi:hypothetical protein